MKRKSQSRPKAGKRRAPSTAWKPGQSGNPGGRPRTDPEFVEACRERTPEAIATLERAMAGVADAPGPAVKAAEVLLNRAWGTAPATVKLDAIVKADVSHDVKAEVIQSPERSVRIVAVLEAAGKLPAGSSAAVEALVKSAPAAVDGTNEA